MNMWDFASGHPIAAVFIAWAVFSAVEVAFKSAASMCRSRAVIISRRSRP